MLNHNILISIFTGNENFFLYLSSKFESKGFSVERLKDKIGESVDYLVIDFTDEEDFDKAEKILTSAKVKTVSITDSSQTKIVDKILKLNDYGSVAVAQDLDAFDYSDSLIRELFSFGHIGKSFEIEGVKLEVQPKKIEEATKTVEVKSSILSVPSTKNIKKLSKFTLPALRIKLNYKIPALIVALLILIFTLSSILQFASLGFLYLGVKSLSKNIGTSEKYLTISKNINELSKVTSLGLIPHQRGYETIKASQTVFASGVAVVKNAQDVTDRIMGDEIYDVTTYANNLSASLDKLYSDLGFFETQIKGQNGYLTAKINNTLFKQKIDLGDIRNKVYNAKTIASRLDGLVGSTKPKKYLLLFQNNMELRPTGGFIGSFALVTFEGGRMTDLNVQDVYSADGQLKGHVEPPQPIKDILGEANWYLRDSNWDPNFPESATRAEWFLEKEIDQTVDGVVALDLNVVKSLLEVTGEIKLLDFDQTVNAKNVYQKTQGEVEGNFFPGSIKKASFLTALSRTLMLELENIPADNKAAILEKLYHALDQKHIQVYLHDTNAQAAIHELQFDGRLQFDNTCGLRCFSDKVALIDANFGVNKSNFFIDRRFDMTLLLNESKVQHKLKVNYVNSANSTLGTLGKYKSYSRLLIPTNAKITSLKILNQTGELTDLDYEEVITGDRKEIGFIVEVLPLEETVIDASWETETGDLSNGGEYRLKFYKQSGTENDPLKVNLATSNSFSLTGGTTPSYNTSLVKDLLIKAFISKK
jgi:hypothetical protein